MRAFVSAAAALLALASAAEAQDIAVVHAKAYVQPGAPPLADATLVIHDGRIAQVGAGLAPPAGAQVVDAHGQVVTPGLMNSSTRLGLIEVESTDDSTDNAVKSGPLGAAFDVQYALNPDSDLIAVARSDGLTRAISLPSGSADAPFAGQGAALRLSDDADILDKPRIAETVMVSGMGASHGMGSRAAEWQVLRNALDEAKAYRDSRKAMEPRDQLLNHLDAEALVPVVEGKVPLAIVTQRESDIRQAIALQRDYGVRVVIVGGAEAWRVADLLAAARIPVVVDPFGNLPYSLDQIGVRFDNAAILQRAGVTVAFALVDPLSSIYTSYLAGEALRQAAGLSVANGMSWDQALAAITVNPARIWGLSDHYGTLAVGQDADLVIWHGDPLDVSSWPEAVFIRGRAQSMDSRETALRDRYAPARAADPWPAQYR